LEMTLDPLPRYCCLGQYWVIYWYQL